PQKMQSQWQCWTDVGPALFTVKKRMSGLRNKLTDGAVYNRFASPKTGDGLPCRRSASRRTDENKSAATEVLFQDRRDGDRPLNHRKGSSDEDHANCRRDGRFGARPHLAFGARRRAESRQ